MGKQFFGTAIHGPSTSASHIAFAWLLQLRWVAVGCQVLVIVTLSRLLHIQIPLLIFFIVIAFQAASNLFFHYLQKNNATIREELFGVIMLWDIIHLTLLIHFTGGPMNPFTFLYLVHVALGAVLVRGLWAWSLAFATIICYAAIFYWNGMTLFMHHSVETPTCIDNIQYMHNMGLHLQGMWVAFSITALFIVYFVSRIQNSLANHRLTFDQLRQEKEKSDRLAALATLSAGAAHEFSTPLATIAVASKEMLYTLREEKCNQELIDDALLIRGQVERCRGILEQLSADAGEHAGEHFESITVGELVEAIVYDFRKDTGKVVTIKNEIPDLNLTIPVKSIMRSFKGILKNSYDADSGAIIRVLCKKREKAIVLTVEDNGPGMNEMTIQRALDPFFTTKTSGKGMGLGLFLAKSVMEQLGGEILISSVQGRETRVSLVLPPSCVAL